MLKAHSSKRKYNFEKLNVGQIKKFDYENYGRIRHAVFISNKHVDEGQFICRVIKEKSGEKKVAVQRIS